jgi:hypothetical protein
MEAENENLIRRFLLGKMPEEERFEFENRFVAEADLFEQIAAVEDELIEKYVRGWMRPEESAEFETVFLVTKKRRDRIEFARIFIDQVTETDFSVTDAVEENAPKRDFFAAVRYWFSSPKVVMAGAMALLVAFVGVWMFSRLLAPNQPEVVFEPNNGDLGTPSTMKPMEPVNSSSPVNSIETPEPTANTETTDQIPAATKTPIPTQIPAIEQPVRNPVLALFSGNLRSGGSNNVLRLSNEAKAAIFILNLPTTDHSTYAAIVTDADGNTMEQFNKLKASKGRVRIVVSANRLKKGDYMIKLDGSNVSGESESVADFQFRVER